MNETWQAFAREAGLAAEHLAIGVTALGRANYAQHAYYTQAFFALSVGLERVAKLILIIDHALQNDGAYPGERQLRAYGHDLERLLNQIDDVSVRHGLAPPDNRLPTTPIHQAIVAHLSEFASNVTRYYNTDLITNSSRIVGHEDPLKAWFERVIEPILNVHYKARYKDRHERNALMIDAMLSGSALVRHHSETGTTLDTPYDASLQTARTDFAKPYVRLYVMQIIRFVACVISELSYSAQGRLGDDMPYLNEFFAIFRNDDQYIMRRKTWSIYGP